MVVFRTIKNFKELPLLFYQFNNIIFIKKTFCLMKRIIKNSCLLHRNF